MNDRKALVRAWLTLFGAIGAFLVLQPALIAFGFVRWVNEMTAQLLAFTLSLFGTPSSAEGTIVRSEIFSLEIIFECTAILPIVLFLAAVAATPSPKRAKLWTFVWGLPAIVLFNLVRLVSLVYIGHLAPRAFETAHLLFWQPLTILFAIALWLVWVERRRARFL
ncbi:MAG: archaeosortase/exosortase family protein [Candidatus Bipolaricaulota bacterium]|nr:archaeosortase/exosortase family protein [Candidatus Bipolaricaulota bacterium]